MVLDECLPYPCDYSYAEKSLTLTHSWLDRSVNEFKKSENLYGKSQYLFPIVQGGIHRDLRLKSAEYISNQNFDGNANDKMGTYNGTVQGATLTIGRNNLNNSAYSFDSTSENYIRKVFNTNPVRTNSTVTQTSNLEVYWLGETYDSHVEEILGTAADTAQKSYGMILAVESGSVGHHYQKAEFH